MCYCDEITNSNSNALAEWASIVYLVLASCTFSGTKLVWTFVFQLKFDILVYFYIIF